jgi:hypothetical protein
MDRQIEQPMNVIINIYHLLFLLLLFPLLFLFSAKRCCVHKEVTRINRHKEALLRYSCSLTSSYLEHLKLELIPELNAKSFNASQNSECNTTISIN